MKISKKVRLHGIARTYLSGWGPWRTLVEVTGNISFGDLSQRAGSTVFRVAVSCHTYGTGVSFTALEAGFRVAGEQFWGRAVRATHDSN
jgi:hypothetical protein